MNLDFGTQNAVLMLHFIIFIDDQELSCHAFKGELVVLAPSGTLILIHGYLFIPLLSFNTDCLSFIVCLLACLPAFLKECIPTL